MHRIVRSAGVTSGIVALSFLAAGPAMAATGSTGEGDASTATGTGLFQILDTGACTATDTASTSTGSTSGRCGDGLNLNDQIKAFTQTASAPGDGTSSAKASAAPIDITNLGTSLDLPGVINGLSNISTGTILDPAIGTLSQNLQTLLKPLESTLIEPLNNALQQALGSVTEALPITLSIGAVSAQCRATSSPKRATGSSSVADINLNVKLGDQTISVPMKLGTAPNSNLLVGAPQDLVNGIIDGLKATFTQSLGGQLQALNPLLTNTVQDQLTNALFSQLEKQLLPQVADALAPIIKGTVNEQSPVSPSSTGEISVTALDLTVLGSNNLKLARTHCGPNAKVAAPAPTQPAQPAPKHHAKAKLPLHVDSGLPGNSHGQGVGEAVLAAFAALFALTGTAGTLAYRRFRMPRG